MNVKPDFCEFIKDAMLIRVRRNRPLCFESQTIPARVVPTFDCNIKTSPPPVILCNLILRDRFAIHKANA